MGESEMARQNVQHGEAGKTEQGVEHGIDRDDAEREAQGEPQPSNAPPAGDGRALAGGETDRTRK